jgi:hypothetical protein
MNHDSGGDDNRAAQPVGMDDLAEKRFKSFSNRDLISVRVFSNEWG